MTKLKQITKRTIAALCELLPHKFTTTRIHRDERLGKSLERARIAADHEWMIRKAMNLDQDEDSGLIGRIFKAAFMSGWIAAKEDDSK